MVKKPNSRFYLILYIDTKTLNLIISETNIPRDLIFLHFKDEVFEFLKHYQPNRLNSY